MIFSSGRDRRAVGRGEVLEQAIAHEETGGDHDRVTAEAEQVVRLEHRIQVRPGDEEAHHFRLARARCELATELRPGVALRIQGVDAA